MSIRLVSEETHICSHCETKQEFISETVQYFNYLHNEYGELTLEQLNDELENFYEEAYQNGQRDAFSKIGSFAEYSYNETLDLDKE